MAPSLGTLAGEFRSLAGDLLLPPAQGRSATTRSLWRLGALVLASGALALGTAVVLLGAAAQLIAWLLGPHQLDLAFPYLGRALRTYTTDRQGSVALAVALTGLAPWWLLQRRLAVDLRRRWLVLTLLLGLLVLSTAVDVAFTEGNGAVMEALNVRSAQRFWGTAAGLTAIYLLTQPVQFLTTYGQERFALLWRDRSSRTLWQAYLAGHAYYRLELAGSIDNPDQRIAEDIDRSVVRSTSLFFGFFASLLSLTAYVLVLFSISGVLVLTLLIATLAGNAAILQLVRRLASLSFRQQALEADFRFALMHLRSHAESVAFLRGEARERSGLERRFARLLVNLERVIRWRTFVGQGSGLYSFVMQFVPYLVLSGAYFGGRVSLGQLTVGSIAFGQVQVALSFLVDRADEFSGLFASLHRIGELRGATAAAAGATPTPGLRNARPELVLEKLDIADPGGDGLLIRGLDLRLVAGQRLLITGPSGCGKTTLLRVLCGLVPAACGRLLTPSPQDWMVLPQKAYLALGSLRDQLLYTCPVQAPAPPDAELRRALTLARLDTLLSRYPDLDVEADWDQVLSGGEQQRLGFARLLLHPSPFVVLDEATSALDLETERHLYGLLLQADLAVISVGHRPSLETFHQRILRLDGHGAWSVQGG